MINWLIVTTDNYPLVMADTNKITNNFTYIILELSF